MMGKDFKELFTTIVVIAAAGAVTMLLIIPTISLAVWVGMQILGRCN